MALNICTHNLNLAEIKNDVYITEGKTIDRVMEEAHQKLNSQNKVVKICDKNGKALVCWYNDKFIDFYLKHFEVMMMQQQIEIPTGMIKEKYICFEWINEAAVKFAELLEKKTTKIPVFHRDDIQKFGLHQLACEDVKDNHNILYLKSNLGIFNYVGIYNEQRSLLKEVHELRKNKVKVLVFDIPDVEDIERELTEDEKSRINNGITGYSHSQESGDDIEKQLRKVYGEENYRLYTEGKIANITQYYRGNLCLLGDSIGDYTNVTNGMRMTTDAPEEYENYIRVLGPCIVGGAYVRDSETIPSFLQRFLNSGFPNCYQVMNYGTCGFYRSYYEKLHKFTVRGGDIIVIIDKFKNIRKYSEKLYEEVNSSLLDMHNRIADNLFFEEPTHMGARGNEEVAKYIYPYISELIKGGAEDKQKVLADIKVSSESNYDISLYQDEAKILDKQYDLSGKVNGAIVMNCNPFTEGHKYLISVARKYVDNLIIFVVEEDKSYFKFEDRKRMVEIGTREFDNVVVLSSRKWILSSLTMPEYFNKELLQEVQVDSAKDVEIFAKLIAPIYHISFRFIGEEPLDKVTAQYNRMIKDICPQYGIEVVEIARKEKVGKVISASRVRELMKVGKYEEIADLVPETTYEYLKGMKEGRKYVSQCSGLSGKYIDSTFG